MRSYGIGSVYVYPMLSFAMFFVNERPIAIDVTGRLRRKPNNNSTDVRPPLRTTSTTVENVLEFFSARLC